jgi:hypothetical protein
VIPRGAFVSLCGRHAPSTWAAAVAAAVAALLVFAAVAALLVFAAVASAAPPPPSGLEVQGGEDAWHPDRAFRLRWRNPGGVAAVHYLVQDAQGSIAVSARRLGWAAEEVAVEVPDLPGVYAAKVWLEDAAGGQGAPAEAKLRFDDTRPGPVEPLPRAAWVGRTGFPVTIRLGHSVGVQPLSGIRGYAVSIGATPDIDPCATPDRCTDAETNLHGGAGNDSLAIAELPEGTSYVHAVAVSGAGIRSAAVGRAALRVDKTDPVTQLAGAPPGWSDHPVTLVATATDSGSGMEPGGDGATPFTAIRVDGGTPLVAAGDSASTTLIAEGAHTVAYYARDLAGNVDDGGSSNGLPNRGPRLVLVRIDRTAPDASFANAQDPLDPELIRVRVADGLSGPDPQRGWIGLRRAGSGDPFSPLPAAPAPAGELRARWDSDAYPAGDYEFEATAYDLAGNATVTTRRANGVAMALSNPLKVTTTLLAAFGGRVLTERRCARRRGRRRCRRRVIRALSLRPAKRTVPFGRGVLLSGHLQNGVGSPLGGSRPVRVIETFAGGGGPTARLSTAWTDAGGAFSFHLAPGPSREVTVAFDGSPTLARSVSRPLSLKVRSVVQLHASTPAARIGGAPVVFRGRVAAAPGTIPPEGKSVQLQFRLPGLDWSEFRTIKTDRRGRFRYAYRFSDNDSRGVRFQFRAYAPAEDGWPYEPGGSLPILVRGI